MRFFLPNPNKNFDDARDCTNLHLFTPELKNFAEIRSDNQNVV